MRELLENRFKSRVRREVREADIYALVMARGDGPTPTPPNTLFCGMQGSAGRIRSNGLPLSMLAAALMSQVERVVTDRTGLAGGWDLEIYIAVQEQLGLKLEPAKGPVEMLIIENVDRPTPDSGGGSA